MGNLFRKWLSMLLAMALLLSGVALMEELPVADEPIVEAAEVVEEDAIDAEEEIVAEAAEEEEISAQAVEEIVEEEEEVDLEESAEDAEPEETEVELTDYDENDEPLLFAAEETDIRIDAFNFPDDEFRAYVSDNVDWEENGDKDGVLTPEEIDAVTDIDVSYLDVSDLTGLEYFTKLEYLYCYNCLLTTLDVSANKKLQELSCHDNSLTKLVVDANTELLWLSCYNNSLTTLDVSNNTNLESLDCESNDLVELTLGSKPSLWSLCCGQNQLTTLDVGDAQELTELYCNDNQLTSLDIGNNAKLYELHCEGNQLTELDISGCHALVEASQDWVDAGSYIDCRNLSFDKNVVLNPKLQGDDTIVVENIGTAFPDSEFAGYIRIKADLNGDDKLSKREIARMTEINGWDDETEQHSFEPSSLKGIEYLTDLEFVGMNGQNIATLDLSKNTKLSQVYLFRCGLTSLTLGKQANLRCLDVSGNKLAKLDIINCPKIIKLINSVKPTEESYDQTTYYSYWMEEQVGENYYEYYFDVDKTTQLVTAAPTPTPTPTPKPTPKPTPTPKPIPVIMVAKKSAKATVYVGTQYRINLNGAVAKSYKSSKGKVAVVDGTGLITPRAQGKAKITIKIGKKKRTLTLKVIDPTIPKKVSLNMGGTVAAKAGTTVTLKAILPAGTYSGIKWKSSNRKVATVVNGVVTFKKNGKVTITATAVRGKKKAKVKFKVAK